MSALACPVPLSHDSVEVPVSAEVHDSVEASVFVEDPVSAEVHVPVEAPVSVESPDSAEVQLSVVFLLFEI